MRVTKRSLIFSSIAVVLAAVTFSSPVGADPSAAIGTIERERCTLTIPVTVGDVVEYELQIWDDGSMLHSQFFTPTAAGETVSLTYTLVSDVNQGAPGIGINVYVEGDELDSIDPWDFEGSDDIARACADSGGTDSGESTTTTTEVAVETTIAEDPSTTTTTTEASNAATPAAAPASATAADPVAATPAYTG